MKLDYSKLPKANLIHIRWAGWPRGRWMLWTRGANYAAIWLGPINISWRMPWWSQNSIPRRSFLTVASFYWKPRLVCSI